MPIREKRGNSHPRVKDAATRIPRAAKDITKNLNQSAENIQERRYDTSEQYAEAKLEEAGKELAQRGQAIAQSAGKAGFRRGKDAVRRSLGKRIRQTGQGNPSSSGSVNATPQPPGSNTTPVSTGRTTAPPRPHGGQGGAVSFPRPVSSAISQRNAYKLHIRYRTGYAQRPVRSPPSPPSTPRAPLAPSTPSTPSVLSAQGTHNANALATQHAQNVQQMARVHQNAQRAQRAARTSPSSLPSPSSTQTMRGIHTAWRGQISARPARAARSVVRGGIKTVKTAKRTVKTAKRAIKTAAQTAKRAQQAANAAKQLAIKTAQAVKAAVQTTIKLISLVIKALIAAGKALVAAIAAGGWVAVVAVIIIAAITAVLISAFGIFFTDEVGDNAYTIQEATAIVEADARAKMQEVIDGAGADRAVIDQDGDGGIIQNWRDILAVYAVKMTTDPDNGMDVITITDEHIEKLKEICLDMNRIDYHTETVTTKKTVTNSDGTTSESTVTEKVLYMAVIGKDARAQAQEYGFTPQQMELLEELLSPDYRAFFTAMLGYEPSRAFSQDELDIIYHNLPEGELGAEIVKLALTRLGDEYDYGHGAGGGRGSKVDCSAFTQWVFGQFGISIPRTAAAQGEFCVDNGLTISQADLVPGDLIFYSHDSNGRYLDITHVAIYAGDGMVVDSSSSRGEVVYRKNYSGAVLYGRPGIAGEQIIAKGAID